MSKKHAHTGNMSSSIGAGKINQSSHGSARDLFNQLGQSGSIAGIGKENQINGYPLPSPRLGGPGNKGNKDNIFSSYKDPSSADFNAFTFNLAELRGSHSPIFNDILSYCRAAGLEEQGNTVLYKTTKGELTKEQLSTAIKYFDKANIICTEQKSNKSQFTKKSDVLLENIDGLIASHNSKDDAYDLAKESLKTRIEKVSNDSKTVLYAYATAARVGIKKEHLDIKDIAEIYQFCHEALKIATTLKLDHEKASIYTCLSVLNKTLGDDNKSETMEAIATAYRMSSLDGKKPITKFGSITEEELKIKKVIQKDILDAIYKSAKAGIWHTPEHLGKKGVAKYLEEEYITNILEKEGLNNESNIDIALIFCFEAINLASIHGESYNPLCAIAFAQLHPKLTMQTMREHPEFLVDESILSTVISVLSNASGDLVGIASDKTEEYIALYTETLHMAYSQFKSMVFTPVSELVTSTKKWDEKTYKKLEHYLSEEHLTACCKEKKIATEPGDENHKHMLNVIRMGAFKTVINAIRENKEDDYASLESYFNALKLIYDNDTALYMFDLIRHIHEDYFTDEKVQKIFDEHYKPIKIEVNTTKLFLAVEANSYELMKSLIEDGANVNAADEEGDTPLHIAAYDNHEEIVQLLLEEGAKVNTQNENKQTPLYIAAAKGNEKIAKLLLTVGADVTILDKNKETLLHIAAAKGTEEIVKLLLDEGVNVDPENEDRETPLHTAAYHGNAGIVELLLKKGASVDKQDEIGDTPLAIAAYRGYQAIAKLLQKYHSSEIDDDIYGTTDDLQIDLSGDTTESEDESSIIG